MVRDPETEPNEPDPRELLRRAKEGDDGALDRLFRMYHDSIHRIASIRMGGRLRRDLESLDLVQNTFLVAKERIRHFDPVNEAAIVNWLAKILQRQISDAWDRSTADKRNRDAEESLEADPPAHAPGPATVAGNDEARRLYDTFVQELEGDEREAYILRRYAKCTWQQVQEELDRPSIEAVQKLFYRAETRLNRIVARRLGHLRD